MIKTSDSQIDKNTGNVGGSVSGVALNIEKRGKNNMIRAIMSGCNGKMGQVITGICKEDADIEIVAGIDLYDGIKNDYPVFPNISVCDVAADVIIDFSNAKAVDDLLVYSVDKQIPVVLCTTGLSEEQLKKVDEASKKVAVLKSANMSLGINMLMELLKQPLGHPMSMAEQVITLVAANAHVFSDLEAAQVKPFQKEMLADFNMNHTDIINQLETTKSLSDDIKDSIVKAAENFKAVKMPKSVESETMTE